MEIKNARIESVSLEMEDHGCLTFYLMLRMGGAGCCFGGYCIGHGYVGAKEFDATGNGLVAMMKIMNVVGVSKWEDLPNKYIRYEDNGLSSSIDKIGNIIEDKWFDIREFFSKNR